MSNAFIHKSIFYKLLPNNHRNILRSYKLKLCANKTWKCWGQTPKTGEKSQASNKWGWTVRDHLELSNIDYFNKERTEAATERLPCWRLSTHNTHSSMVRDLLHSFILKLHHLQNEMQCRVTCYTCRFLPNSFDFNKLGLSYTLVIYTFVWSN